MNPHQDWILDYKETNGGQVILGNNKSCTVRGIGTVTILTPDGCERKLREVRYVPELKRNLVSLGMLDSASFSFKAENGVIKIVKGSVVYMRDIDKMDCIF